MRFAEQDAVIVGRLIIISMQTNDKRRQSAMKRQRGRGRKSGHQNSNRSLDSNGPSVKIRGTASQISEKYQALARDANLSGDRIAAENFMQHAEHYYRLVRAAQANAAQNTGNNAAPAPHAEAGETRDQASGASGGESQSTEPAGNQESRNSQRQRRRRPAPPHQANGKSRDRGGDQPAEAPGVAEPVAPAPVSDEVSA